MTPHTGRPARLLCRADGSSAAGASQHSSHVIRRSVHTRQRWSCAPRLIVVVGLANLLVVVILAVLMVCGRADLATELVVGAVVVCVLGTPLGCLLGLVMFYVWAMSRMARARSRSAHPAAISHVAETPMSIRDVIVIEERS